MRKFGSNVEFTKIKIKTCYVYFFKEFINKRGWTPTLELDEDNVSTFAKFGYEQGSLKTERVFEKTNIISCFHQFSISRDVCVLLVVDLSVPFPCDFY